MLKLSFLKFHGSFNKGIESNRLLVGIFFGAHLCKCYEIALWLPTFEPSSVCRVHKHTADWVVSELALRKWGWCLQRGHRHGVRPQHGWLTAPNIVDNSYVRGICACSFILRALEKDFGFGICCFELQFWLCLQWVVKSTTSHVNSLDCCCLVCN